VQLPGAVAEVLHEPVAQPDELAQVLGRGLGQPRRRRPLLGGEAGDAERVDRVGLGAFEVLAGEASGGSGLSSATVKPFAARTANRFFQ
jgi:hypothetical protein